MKNSKIRVIVMMGLLIALDVIASSFLTIKTPIVKVGLSFVPISFTGMIFGPVLGGVGALISDIVQYLLFPAGAYIPGLSISSALSGLIYGFFLYGKRPAVWRVLVSVSISKVFLSILLNTFWLYLTMPGKTFEVLLLSRLPNNLILIPIQTVIIYAVWQTAYRTKLIKDFGFAPKIATR